MFWNGKYTGEIVTIKGEMCAPIKPIINLNPSQDMSIFEFEKSTVLYIGEVLEKAPAEKDDLDSHFNLKCKLCNRMIKPIEMRTHIGAHILKDNLKYKCGFCGGPNANCDNKLIPTNKKKGVQYYKVSSNCDYKVLYKRKPDTYSARNKCTNHVLLCPQCSSIQWKYTLPEHFQDCHNEYGVPDEFAIKDIEKNNLKL